MEKSSFLLQFKCLNLAGFNENGKNKFPNFFRGIQIFNFLCFVFCFLTEIKYVSENLSDLLSFVEACGPILAMTMTFSKTMTITISKKMLYQIADQLEKLATGEKDGIIIKQVKRINIMTTKLYLIVGGMTGISYWAIPLLINLMNFIMVTGESYREIPMKSSFPYNVSLSPAYEITYAMYSYTTFVVVVTNVKCN